MKSDLRGGNSHEVRATCLMIGFTRKVKKMVYILDVNGEPLMPTERHGKVRRLLKEGKAKVVRREPFTIRLLYETESHIVQELMLGVDTGSKTIGTAVSTTDGKIFYASEVEIRNDISERMTQRSKYRRSRRNRKTRYRKARFDNRRNSIKTDRFSPTIVSKLHSHEREINFIESILPISSIILETGTFDPQLMKDETLRYNKWGYQKGPNYGFENTKAKVLFRDDYTCQCCKGKRKDSKLEVHHIIYRSKGGSDDEKNLITLCHSCHKDLHAGKIKKDFTGKRKGTLKHATQMNSIRKQLLRRFHEAIETYGHITKANRQELKLSKEHYIDACVIASGGIMPNIKTKLYIKKEIPKGDYQRSKGVRSQQMLPKGKIHGFKKFDKVTYNNEAYFIKGRMTSGYAVLMDINGNKADFSHMPKGKKTPKLKELKRIQARSGQMIATKAIHSTT